MARKIYNKSKPKAYAVDAVLSLGKMISVIKQDLSEQDLIQLRKMYVLARNLNDDKELSKMVKLLNCKKSKTGSSFQVISGYSPEHGHNTLEIRENRF